MASSFKILRSTTAGHIPTPEQIADYHFAINEADGILFWVNPTGVVQSFPLVPNPTAAQILAALLTVDGVGSGLDADTLQGYAAAAFSLVGHSHAGYASSGIQITGGGLASGGGDLGQNRVITVTKASTAQAQAGTDDATAMTPAKTNDEITSKVPALISAAVPGLISETVPGLISTAILGKVGIWIPAIAISPRLTNGPSTGKIELSTNKVIVETLDFDQGTQEYAQFDFRFPKSWNKGTVTFSPVWSHPSTSTNFGVCWSLAGVAIPDGANMDVAFGTAQNSVDTGGSTNRAYQGPESSAITIAGTLNDNSYCKFQISRVVANAGDTLGVDARLAGIHLYMTTSALNDA